MQEGDTVFRRQTENIRVQELKKSNARLFIGAARESSHQAEAVLAVQFFSGDLLDHVQEFLCNEAFEFAEGLFLKNLTYLFHFARHALTHDQFSNFPEHRRGRA